MGRSNEKKQIMTNVTNPQWHQCASRCYCAKHSLTAMQGLDHTRFSLHSLLYHMPAEPQTVSSNPTLQTSTYTSEYTHHSVSTTVPWNRFVLAVLSYSVCCLSIYCPCAALQYWHMCMPQLAKHIMLIQITLLPDLHYNKQACRTRFKIPCSWIKDCYA
jgi:hypothetical protein